MSSMSTDAVVVRLLDAVGRVVGRPRPCRLAHLEELVEADLHVEAAGRRERRRVRPLDDLHAVGLLLHLEADAEAAVGPDLVVDHARRLLGGQDEVHAEAAADARRAHELAHELRLLALQLGELVRDDQQVRQRLGDRAVAIQALVLVDVDVARAGGRAGLVEERLPPLQLALDRDQRAVDRGPVEVGDGSGDVRQIRRRRWPCRRPCSR